MKDEIRRISAWFKPVYDELQTYIITLICALLLTTHLNIRTMFARVHAMDLLALIPIACLALFGGALSLFNVLIRRPKQSWEKTAMAGIAMGANGTAGLVGGMEVLPRGFTPAAIIPLWNIVTGALLLYQMAFISSEELISDEDTTLRQVGIATGWLLGVFAVCEWLLKLSWPMTFSVSTAFASISANFFRGPQRLSRIEEAILLIVRETARRVGPLPRLQAGKEMKEALRQLGTRRVRRKVQR